MKKLIPAIVMLLVSAIVLSTASYAWFTTSQTADASGMNVTAEAPTSILIRGQYASGNWTDYTSFVDFATVRPNENRLYAASSLTGEEFFAPANCEDTTGAMKFGTAIVAKGENDGVYVDYVVELQNTSAANDVALTVESITLGNLPIAGAVRVAIIVKGAGDPIYQKDAEGNEVLVDGEKVQIGNEDVYFAYNPKPDTSKEWVAILGADGKAVEGLYANGPLNAASAAVVVPDPVKDEETGAVTNQEAINAAIALAQTNAKGVAPAYSVIGEGTAGTKICTLPALTYDEAGAPTTDNVQQIVIRIWIEGQDSACITGYAGQDTTVKVVFGVHSTTPIN